MLFICFYRVTDENNLRSTGQDVVKGLQLRPSPGAADNQNLGDDQ